MNTLDLELSSSGSELLKASSKQDATHLFQKIRTVLRPVATVMKETGTPTRAMRLKVWLSTPVALVVLWFTSGFVTLIVAGLIAAFFKSAEGTTYTSGKMISGIGALGGQMLPLMVGATVGGSVGGWVVFKLLDSIARGAKNPSSRLVFRAMLAVVLVFTFISFVSAFFTFPKWEDRIFVPLMLGVGAFVLGVLMAEGQGLYLQCPQCGEYLTEAIHASLPLDGIAEIRSALAAEESPERVAEILKRPAHFKHVLLQCRSCSSCGGGFVEAKASFCACWSDRPEDRKFDSWIVVSEWLGKNNAGPLRKALEQLQTERKQAIAKAGTLIIPEPKPDGPAPGRLEIPIPAGNESLPPLSADQSTAPDHFSPWGTAVIATLIAGGIAFFAWLIFAGGYNGGSRTNIAVIPGTTQIFAAGDDGIARLWDADSGQMLREFRGHKQSVNAVAVSQDGKLGLTGGGRSGLEEHDSTIRWWDITTGNQIGAAEEKSFVFALAFAPDGKVAASGHGNDDIRIWSVMQNRLSLAASLEGHNGTIRAVAFSPDSRYLITGDAPSHFSGADCTVRLWDATSGQQLRRYAGHKKGITSLCFAPDGKSFFSASEDHTVRQWAADEVRELQVFTGHAGAVHDIAASFDGTSIATASEDATIRIWRVPVSTAAGAKSEVANLVIGELKSEGPVFRVAFAPGGKQLYSTRRNAVDVWDLNARTRLRTLNPAK